MIVVRVAGLSCGYGDRPILRDIRMELKRGEVVSIVGPNGAGKSTLLKSLAAIIPPPPRRIWIGGEDMRLLKPAELAKKQAYVPQQAPLGFPLTVMDTVLLGRKPYIRWGVAAEDLRLVGSLLADLSLEPFAERYVDELSGGERQKVLIARALAQQPEVLLLDEPTSALDIRHQLEVLELVRGLAKRANLLVVLVLHDLELAARYSDTIHLMRDGQIYRSGRPEDVFTQPNLEAVYGVRMDIGRSPYGLKLTAIGPLSPERACAPGD